MSTHLKRHHGSDTDPVPGYAKPVQKSSTMGGYVQKLGQDSPRAHTISRAIACFLVSEFLPFTVIESPMFAQLLAILEPKYQIPAIEFFRGSLFPQLCEEAKLVAVWGLSQASSVAITVDKWSSGAFSHVTVIGHYMTSEWQLVSRILRTHSLLFAHRENHMVEVLAKVIEDWKLERRHRLLPVTTDNDGDMSQAVQSANIGPHVGCFAQAVNTAALNALHTPALVPILGHIRRIIAFFMGRPKAKELLQEKRSLLRLPEQPLLLDSPKRWNSSYDMLQRFLEQEHAVRAALRSKDLHLAREDLTMVGNEDLGCVEKTLDVLRPLMTITNLLCESGTPTISLILPLKEKIMHAMKLRIGDTSLEADLKMAVRDNLALQYGVTVEEFLLQATAVDPRFCTLGFLGEEERDKVYSSLAASVIRLNKAAQQPKVRQ